MPLGISPPPANDNTHMVPTDSINLYDEGTAPTLRTSELAAYLQAQTGSPSVTRRGPFLMEYASTEDHPRLAAGIARCKVRNLDAPPQECQPAYGEIEFERRRLANGDRGPFGVLYDGIAFQRLLRGLLPPDHVRLPDVRIVFTNRMIGTWDEGDRRYHLRAIVLGIPALISTTGLVEAPAKPRDFYLARQQIATAARPEVVHELLKERFQGQFLDHDDERLTDVAKGYAVQAALYQLAGETFCDNPDCRLFNAHWQADLIRAQLNGTFEYCPRHRALLADMRSG